MPWRSGTTENRPILCLVLAEDNVAPCIYGGFQLGIHNGERWWTDRVTMRLNGVFEPNTRQKRGENASKRLETAEI